MKNPWVVIGLLAVILFGGAFWYSSTVTERNNEGVEVTDHIKGNPEASVTLAEFSDFQCPACAAFQPVVAEVLETYGDQIAFEYKHFPLPIHPNAVPAAMAAEAAGQQGMFFEYHDVLFDRQQEWSTSPAPSVQFRNYAEELGLDIDTFTRHQNATILRDRVRAQFQEGQDLNVTGTPTFFLNGERMVIQTYEDFLTQIAAAVDPSVTDNATSTSNSDDIGASVEFGI